jgi:hypothetical protein
MVAIVEGNVEFGDAHDDLIAVRCVLFVVRLMFI